MEKTFREVIKDIKEGEVWENENRKITINDLGEIFIKDKITGLRSFNPKVKYKLQRREYAFEEAFKAYEEGKEIESIRNKVKFKKKDDAQLFYKFEHMNKRAIADEDTAIFSIDEIRGKWYIND